MGSKFQDLLVVIRPFKELWSKVPSGERQAVTIPDKLIQAWLSLLSAVVLGRQNHRRWQRYMSTAHDLIEEGIRMIMQSRETVRHLFNKAVVQPGDLAALLLSKSAQRVLQPKSSASPNPELPGLDIAEAYRQYLRQLVSKGDKKKAKDGCLDDQHKADATVGNRHNK